MTYEIQLIDKISKELIHSFNSVFEPMVDDIIVLSPIENEIYFVVKYRMLLDSHTNRIACIGTKQFAHELDRS